MNFRSKLKSSGYDQEEAYFHQKDRELIQKMKKNRTGNNQLILIQGGVKEQNVNAPMSREKKAA